MYCYYFLIHHDYHINNIFSIRDTADDKDVILEVRPGTGGDEASLFASEILKMYEKYASKKGWTWELLSLSKTEVGGFKEAQASITGEFAFRNLKFESGVHRVQRIPVNDVKIQTSAVSVVVRYTLISCPVYL